MILAFKGNLSVFDRKIISALHLFLDWLVIDWLVMVIRDFRMNLLIHDWFLYEPAEFLWLIVLIPDFSYRFRIFRIISGFAEKSLSQYEKSEIRTINHKFMQNSTDSYKNQSWISKFILKSRITITNQSITNQSKNKCKELNETKQTYVLN